MADLNLVFSRARYTGGSIDLVFGSADGSFVPSLGAVAQFGTPLWVGHKASGFISGNFGTPSTALKSFGFRSTEYGRASLTFAVAPVGPLAQLSTPIGSVHYTPSGFISTSIGVPSTPLLATGFASSSFGIGSIPLIASPTGPVVTFGTGLGKNIQVAVGFASTMLGTPMVAPIALGFRLTAFGIGSIPLRVTTIPPNTSIGPAFGRHFFKAAGFRHTTFGTPAVAPIALGFVATVFGSPDSRQYFRVMAALPATVVSTAYYAINQVGQASGSVHANVGLPAAFEYEPSPVGATAQAFGFSGTVLGAPAAAWDQFAVASGSVTTALGTPAAVAVHPATGFQPTAFGTPQTNLAAQAEGFRSTLFGAPRAATIHPAASTYRATRFGLPVGVKVNARCVYGFTRHGRFGQPRGRTFFPRVTSGFRSTLLGAHTSSENRRVTHIAPVTRFGSPGVWFAGGGQHGHASGFTSTAVGVPDHVDV